VTGFDINPMSYWIVKQEIEHLDLEAYGVAVESLSRSWKRKSGTCINGMRSLWQEGAGKILLWVKVNS